VSGGQTAPPRPPLGLSGVDPDLLGDSANDAPDEWGRIPVAAVPSPTLRASTEASSEVGRPIAIGLRRLLNLPKSDHRPPDRARRDELIVRPGSFIDLRRAIAGAAADPRQHLLDPIPLRREKTPSGQNAAPTSDSLLGDLQPVTPDTTMLDLEVEPPSARVRARRGRAPRIRGT
jgi:hypothetical protein